MGKEGRYIEEFNKELGLEAIPYYGEDNMGK